MSNLVSIIIPAYNAEAYIMETVSSVIEQTYNRWELFIVDDGSTDGTYQICRKFSEKDDRITVVRQENSGVSEARNHGFRLSSGSLVAFLDSDDVWLPDNLMKKIAVIESGDYGLVHSDAGFINAESQRTEGGMAGKEGYLLEDYLLWKGSCIPGPSSAIIKREVLSETGLFDPKLSTSADQDLFIRICANYRIGRLPEITWYYRIHDMNMHKGIGRMERDVLRVFRKAEESGLMKSSIRRKSWGITYRILGASWAGDGKNKWRGLRLILKSLFIYPEGITGLIKKSPKVFT